MAVLAEQTKQISVTGPSLACSRPSGLWMSMPWPTAPAAVWERPEVWYDAPRRGAAACEAAGVIAATTSAVGRRVLIDGSEGSARASRSATTPNCIGLGASAAVSDSRFAAGPGSQTNTVAAHARRLRPGLSPHGRAR